MARIAFAFLALVLVAAAASAHGPPTKRDQDFRLLADHNDDCGGHDAGGLSDCNGTHDLVGLDVREAHDAVHGDVVVFRFLLNGGTAADGLKDVLTLKAGSSSKTFELRTTDNQAFQGTGFDLVGGAEAARNPDGTQDGTRFVVEASVKAAALGGLGAKIDDYVVTAYRGPAKGDYMPGGYVNSVGVDDANPDQGDGVTNFERSNGYVLQGPTYFAAVEAPAKAAIRSDGTEVVDVTVRNLFANSPQVATITVTGADGFTATWVGANGADPAVLDLAKGATNRAELRLRGDGLAVGTTGTLHLEVLTNLGGRTLHDLPYEIVGASTSSSEPATGGGGQDKGAPALGLPLAAGLLAFAALRRRT